MIFKINIFILKNQKRITKTRKTHDLYYGLVQNMYFFMLFMGSQKFPLHNVNIAVWGWRKPLLWEYKHALGVAFRPESIIKYVSIERRRFYPFLDVFVLMYFIFKLSSIIIVWTSHRKITANEGPVRIQYKCLVPICAFPEMKLRGLVTSKKDL